MEKKGRVQRSSRNSDSSRSQRLADSMSIIAKGVTKRDSGQLQLLTGTVTSNSNSITELAASGGGAGGPSSEQPLLVEPTGPEIAEFGQPIRFPQPLHKRANVKFKTLNVTGASTLTGALGCGAILSTGTIKANGSGSASQYLDGTGVYSTPGGPAGGLTRITETVLASDTTVTFSSIPGSYWHLLIVWNGRATGASTSLVIDMRFNGDTGSNYDWQRTISDAASNAASEGLAVTFGQAGILAGSTASRAGMSGSGTIYIPNYIGTTFEKQASTESGCTSGTGTAAIITMQSTVGWRNTAAITQIDLFASSGSIKTGSVFTLYGLG